MLRLFVALRPPSTLRAHLLETMHGVVAARWQSDAQLHLTLAFLGAVSEADAERIDAALAMLSGNAIALGIEGVGHFTEKGCVTSLWAAATPAPQLAILAGKVEQAIVRAGVKHDKRAFVPHITLARLNRSAGPVDGWLAAHAALAIAAMPIDRFGLYESRLGKHGSAYHLLADYPLRTARS